MLKNSFLTPGARSLVRGLTAPKTSGATLDAAEVERHVVDAAADYEAEDTDLSAAGIVQQWAETSDLDEGEGLADRLVAMLSLAADDGEADEMGGDAMEVAANIGNSAWDYLASKGADDADIEAIFGDDPVAADAAAARVRDLLVSSLPDGQEAAFDDVNDWAFRVKPVLDAAVYKKAMVVRGGRKVRIMKRISGMVRRTAAQKLAIKKARMRANSGAAKMHRAKSMRVRRSMGGLGVGR